MKQKEYTFQDILFYCIDSLKVERDANGNVVEERKIEGFPRLDFIKEKIPELKDKSPQEVLDFFEAQGNEVLCIEEKLNPVYSVLGIRYTANGSQRPNQGLEELGSQIGANLEEVANDIDRAMKGQKILHTKASDGILSEKPDEIILTLQKYFDLGKPTKLVRDGERLE
jgi:hypothetical protein